ADRTSITGTQGVDIRAHHDNVTMEREAGRFAGGTANALGDDSLTDTVTGLAGATIYAGARPADTPLVRQPSSTGEPGPFAPLALFVEADNNNFTRHRDPIVIQTPLGPVTLAFDNDSSTSHEPKTITWNSDVVISTGQTPELVVDANGNVV